MRFHFHPDANAEFDNAVEYYELCQSGLGLEFAEEVYAAIARIIEYPGAWAPLSDNTRRCLTNRFPYGVIYQVRTNSIHILAASRPSQQPGSAAAWTCSRAAQNLADIDAHGFNLHQLKGDRQGEWAISVSGNWRITFRFAVLAKSNLGASHVHDIPAETFDLAGRPKAKPRAFPALGRSRWRTWFGRSRWASRW